MRGDLKAVVDGGEVEDESWFLVGGTDKEDGAGAVGVG